MKMRTFLGFFFIAVLIGSARPAQAQQYDVLPHRPNSYGQIWVAEGASQVNSENQSWGNRFRVGADLRFGDDARFIAGWTFLDVLSSGEHAASVGDISRAGGGPDFGYFVIPDRLWVVYTFDLGAASGSRVSGSAATYGHQLTVGYKFLTQTVFDVSAEIDYRYLPGVSVPVLDLNTNTGSTATYPYAQVWTVGLVLSFDLG